MSGAIAEAPTSPAAESGLVLLRPDQLAPWPGLNPRKHIREERVRELAASIREEGVLQNLVVHETGEEVKWIVAGQTRWSAVRRLWSYGEEILLPASLRTYTERRAFAIAMLENSQRQDLTVIEQARGFHRMVHEYGYTQEEVAAEILGDSRKQSQVAKRLGLLALPESVLELVEMEVIPWSYAYDHLLGWTREEAALQAKLFGAIVESVRTTRDFGGPVARGWFVETVRKIGEAHKPAAPAADPAQITVEESIAAAAEGLPGLTGSWTAEVRAEAEHLLGAISTTCDQLEAGDAGPRALDLDLEEFHTFAAKNGLEVDEAANPTLRRAREILGAHQEAYRSGVAPAAEVLGAAPPTAPTEAPTPAGHRPGAPVPDLTAEQACLVREMAQQRADGFDEYARRQFLDAVDDALEGRSRTAEEGSIYQRAQAWVADVVAAVENGEALPLSESGAVQAVSQAPEEPAPAQESQQQRAARERLESRGTVGVQAPGATTGPATPIATLPPPGSARAAVREGAGIIETVLAVLGGRPSTIAILPSAGGVTLTLAPRITKAGETPFFLTAPTAGELDAKLAAALDTHFKS